SSVMPAGRNQEVTVRRPEAKRMPASSRGKRAAVRRSSQAAKWAKARDNQAGKCENGMAGPSSWRCGVATIIVRRGPAGVHPLSGPAGVNKHQGVSGSDKGHCEKVAESAAFVGTLWVTNPTR